MATGSEAKVSSARIVGIALVIGCVAFAVIAAYIVRSGGPRGAGPGLDPVMPMIAVGLCGMSLVLSLVIWKSMAEQARKRLGPAAPDGAVAESYAIACITRGALLEAPALFAIVSFLLTGEWWVLGIAAAGVIGLVVTIPSRTGFDAYRVGVTGKGPFVG